MGFWGWNFKNLSLDSESASLRQYVKRYSDKTDKLERFGHKLVQKLVLGLEFQKSKSGFGISILEILAATISRQKGELWIFWLKFALKWIFLSEFQKSQSRFGIRILEIVRVVIFRQNGQFWTFGLQFALK